jgi:hypothetical protein
MNKQNKHFVKFRFLGVLAVLASIAVFSAVAMALWNALMPGLFGLAALNYWQAAGIFLLARILCGGGEGLFWLGPGHMRHAGWGRHGNPFREKWMNMTEEERKAFIEKQHSLHHFFDGRFPYGGDCRDEKGRNQERNHEHDQGHGQKHDQEKKDGGEQGASPNPQKEPKGEDNA